MDPTDPSFEPVSPTSPLPEPAEQAEGSAVTEEVPLEVADRPRPSWGRLIAGLSLVLALVAGTLVFILTRSSGVALALSLSKGNEFHYHETVTLDGTFSAGGQGQPLKETVTSDATWRVVSVDAKGIATVEVTATNTTVSLGGQTIPATKPVTIRMTMTPDGRILSGGDVAATNSANAGPTIPGGSQFTPLLPDHKVGPGDAWQKSFDSAVPLFGGTLHYDTTNRFLRYETVGGSKAAVIQSTMTVPMSLQLDLIKLLQASGTSAQDLGLPAGAHPVIGYDGKAAMTGTYWLDPEHGQLIKASLTEKPDFTLTFHGFPQVPEGSTGTFTGTMTIKLDPR